MTKEQRRLGRGLNSLISSTQSRRSATADQNRNNTTPKAEHVSGTEEPFAPALPPSTSSEKCTSAGTPTPDAAPPTPTSSTTVISQLTETSHTASPNQEREADQQSPSTPFQTSEHNPAVNVLPIDKLIAHSRQPRQAFNASSIGSLAKSIAQSGIVQPLVVRRMRNQPGQQQPTVNYEIIAGERRWRAARAAGLDKVPVVVRELTDQEALELAIVENIQREDLNAIDRAAAYRTYCVEFNLNPEEVARRIGEDRSTVVNYIRLLDLPQEVKDLVATGRLSMGHARCILGVPSDEQRISLAQRAVSNSLSVRVLEDIVRRQKAPDASQAEGKDSGPRQGQASPHIADLQERLQRSVGTRVTIKEGRKKGSGRIMIDYYSLDDFDRISTLLGLEDE